MNRLLNIGDLRRAAVAVGATVEQDSPGVYQVCAPAGKQWAEGNCLHLRVDFEELGGRRGNAQWASDCIRDAIARIGFGYEERDPENCDEGD